MKLKRFLAFGTSTVLSLSSLFVFAPVAHAATITWDGGGSTNNFSEGANWSGDVVPGTNDVVVFNNTVDSGDQTYANDLVGAIFQGITFAGGGTNHYTVSGNAFELTAGIVNNSSARHTISANINLDGNQTVNTASGQLELDGVLTGSNILTKSGTQILYLNGNNSAYSGAIAVTAGTLDAGHVNALGTVGAGTTVTDGAQLQFSVASGSTIAEPLTLAGDGDGLVWTNFALGSLSFSDDITLSGAITLTANTQLAANAKLTITGAITGSFTLVMSKTFSGQIILNSSNNNSSTPNGTLTAPVYTTTYADDQPASPITANYNETVVVTGKRQAAYVDKGGILKGTGTVGALTVADGGTLAPGQSPGCLNSGNLLFNNGSTYEFEVGGATECTEYDQTKVTGTVALGDGILDLVLFNDFKPTAGQNYTIISNDAADAVTGTFEDLAEGATFEVDGYVFGISYIGGDGNDVVVSVKSVPGSPDTGFKLLAQNPITTFATTTVLAASLYIMSRRVRRSVH